MSATALKIFKRYRRQPKKFVALAPTALFLTMSATSLKIFLAMSPTAFKNFKLCCPSRRPEKWLVVTKCRMMFQPVRTCSRTCCRLFEHVAAGHVDAFSSMCSRTFAAQASIDQRLFQVQLMHLLCRYVQKQQRAYCPDTSMCRSGPVCRQVGVQVFSADYLRCRISFKIC
jgi:hypothetical protein